MRIRAMVFTGTLSHEQPFYAGVHQEDRRPLTAKIPMKPLLPVLIGILFASNSLASEDDLKLWYTRRPQNGTKRCR